GAARDRRRLLVSSFTGREGSWPACRKEGPMARKKRITPSEQRRLATQAAYDQGVRDGKQAGFAEANALGVRYALEITAGIQDAIAKLQVVLVGNQPVRRS